jgi:hypothetical protein
MGDHRLYKFECFHILGMPESERQKVTALNLSEDAPPCGGFPLKRPPDRLSPLSRSRFLHITTQSLKGEEMKEILRDQIQISCECCLYNRLHESIDIPLFCIHRRRHILELHLQLWILRSCEHSIKMLSCRSCFS